MWLGERESFFFWTMSKGITSVNHYPAIHQQVLIWLFCISCVLFHFPCFVLFFKQNSKVYLTHPLAVRDWNISLSISSLLVPFCFKSFLSKALPFPGRGLIHSEQLLHQAPPSAFLSEKAADIPVHSHSTNISPSFSQGALNETLGLDQGWCGEENKSCLLETRVSSNCDIRHWSKNCIYEKPTCHKSVLS